MELTLLIFLSKVSLNGSFHFQLFWVENTILICHAQIFIGKLGEAIWIFKRLEFADSTCSEFNGKLNRFFDFYLKKVRYG